MSWLPIETAPKEDGKQVLLGRVGWGYVLAEWYVDQTTGVGCWIQTLDGEFAEFHCQRSLGNFYTVELDGGYGLGVGFFPTHWMPLAELEQPPATQHRPERPVQENDDD